MGKAIALSQELKKAGHSKDEVWQILDAIKDNPDDVAAEDTGFALAQTFINYRKNQPVELQEPLNYKVWGESLISSDTYDQMKQAMELPVTVGGALMPDAHHGYGIPIGGVVALENAVAPYMVGVDIACRMMMTIYPAEDLGFLNKNNDREKLRRAMRSETRFGINAGFDANDRRDSWVLDEADRWKATPLLSGLKDKAHRQLGSSGGGNHFVDAGILEIEANNALNLEPGSYFALMSHSGSRGVGGAIAQYYTKRAIEKHNLPKTHKYLAWLDLDTEAGQEYWHAMQLAGDFASECHHAIHRTIAKKLGIKPITEVENHHNFAWKESWQGKEVVVHRKGATPAHEGVLGVIPGSQGHESFIVEGLGSADSLYSASHGAGRQMSRRKAIDTISRADRDNRLKNMNVELLGSSMDEAPGAYKNIHQVLAAQQDLVKILATFHPRMVIMAD